MKEIWKAVVGHPGYEVSDRGRVRSLDKRVRCRGGKTRLVTGRVLKPQAHTQGYASVRLYPGGTRTIHSLVAASFLGPRPQGHQVAHNDGTRVNNSAKNLRYATPSENQADRRRHGTCTRGERHPAAKLTARDVTRIRTLVARGQYQRTVANMFGVRQPQVSRIIRRERWAYA